MRVINKDNICITNIYDAEICRMDDGNYKISFDDNYKLLFDNWYKYQEKWDKLFNNSCFFIETFMSNDINSLYKNMNLQRFCSVDLLNADSKLKHISFTNPTKVNLFLKNINKRDFFKYIDNGMNKCNIGVRYVIDCNDIKIITIDLLPIFS